MEVGELRQSTIDEHHDICLALVVKLKDKMKKEGETAFAYRKADGTIRYAHGIISDNFDVSGRYFVYFDTDKGEERKFRIDAFIGIGEPEELQNSKAASISETQSAASSTKAYNDFSSLDIKIILAKRGVAIEETENFMVIDLLPELNKEQLKDLQHSKSKVMPRPTIGVQNIQSCYVIQELKSSRERNTLLSIKSYMRYRPCAPTVL